jgi:hypothetical protein
MAKVTIGATEVNLAAKDLPEFSYSLNELTDPAKLQGSRSTTFNVPATNAAKEVLGGASLAEQADATHDFRIGDGGAVIFQGKCSPVEWTDDAIRILAVGDNAGWMSAAKGTKLSDLELGSSGVVTDQYQRDSWTDYSGIDVYPLIDYGSFVDRSSTHSVATQKLRPGLRTWRLLQRFFADNGYSVEVKGGLSRVWRKMYLPNTTDKINGDAPYLASKSVRQTMVSGYSYSGYPVAIPTDTIASDPAGIATANSITPIVGTRYRVTVSGDIYITRTFSNFAPSKVLVYVYDVTSASAKLQKIVDIPLGSANETVSLNNLVLGELDIVSGRTYRVTFGVFNSAFGHTINVGRWEVKWDMVQAEYIENITLDLKTCAPKMTVAELVSGMVNTQRLIVSTDDLSHVVTFSYLDDFLEEAGNGIDWRQRIDHGKPPAKVQPEVPSTFEFRYKEDKGDAYLVDFADRNDIGFGDVDYITGGVDKPVQIEVPFAATFQDVRFNGLVIPCLARQGPYYQQDYYSFVPRILVLADLSPGDWIHDGQAQTQYPRSYFAGTQAGDASLCFADDRGREGTVATRWRDYLRRITSPYLRAEVRVYDDEFMGFAFGRPRLVHDGYHQVWCYVQSVKGKRFGQDEPVECELIPM